MTITYFHLLPPANEVCEGYVFTPVSQSFCSQRVGGGVCFSVCWDTYPPPPGADTPWEQTPPRSRHLLPHAVHAGRYRQQVGGMHPTGMHTCSVGLLED